MFWGHFYGIIFSISWLIFTPKSNFSPKLGHLGNFFKMFTTLKLKQFLKHALGTKWELKSLARHQLKTKIPQELNEQLKLKPGTKSSASGAKLWTLAQTNLKRDLLPLGVASDQSLSKLGVGCSAIWRIRNAIFLFPQKKRFLYFYRIWGFRKVGLMQFLNLFTLKFDLSNAALSHCYH